MKDLSVTMQTTMSHAYVGQEDIPEIDLYVDQIVTLLERELGGVRRTEEEKLLTKTMVNNYSKDGLLKRIKGKKYSKEHIEMILLIVGLKRGLAVQDIGRVLSGVFLLPLRLLLFYFSGISVNFWPFGRSFLPKKPPKTTCYTTAE